MTKAELEAWRTQRANWKARFRSMHIASTEPDRYCAGPFAIFIEEESSWRCRRCNYITFHRSVHLRSGAHNHA
jgi:hypothetical protein